MARLPNTGEQPWDTVLNTYLGVAHNTDGTHNGSFSYLGQTGNPLIARLRAAAKAAYGRNSLELGVHPTPPTITTGITTLDATLTHNYYVMGGQAANFTYRGGTATNAVTVYYLFPVVTLPTGTGNATTSPTNQNANGWAVEFYSDAPKVQLFVLNNSGAKGIQVEVDNYLVGANPIPFPAGSGSGNILLDFTSAGGAKVRKFRVEGDQAAGWRGVNVGPLYSVWAANTDHEIVCASVGDSVQAQQGTVQPNGGWDISLGKLLGWSDVRQIAIGGTGFVAPGSNNSTFGDSTRLADAARVTPDIILMGSSSNDTSGGTLQTAMLTTFRAYRTAFPNALIVVHGIWPGATGPSAAVLNIEADTNAAFVNFADPLSFNIGESADAQGAWVFGTGRAGTKRSVSDAVLNSTTTVTSATANFTAGDVGLVVSATGIPTNTKIASVTNTTTAVLSAAATTSTSGVALTITNQNLSGNSDMYVNATDTIHPSQAGHDYYAKRFANAFKQKVLGVLA